MGRLFCARTGESFCFVSPLRTQLARRQENCCPGRQYGLWVFRGGGGRLDFSHESHRFAVIRSNPMSTTCTLEHDTMETWYWRVLITARSEVRISYRRNKKSRLVRRALRILLRYETLQLRLIGVITLPTFLPSPLIFLARAILYLTREGQQSSQMLQSKHTPLPPLSLMRRRRRRRRVWAESWGGRGDEGREGERVSCLSLCHGKTLLCCFIQRE